VAGSMLQLWLCQLLGTGMSAMQIYGNEDWAEFHRRFCNLFDSCGNYIEVRAHRQ